MHSKLAKSAPPAGGAIGSQRIYLEEPLPAWEYSVRRIPLESYDEIDNALEAAITSQAGDDWELVSCFPEQLHHMGMFHELPTTEPGADPYDAIWQGPMGPTFITVFRRPIGD